jgi:hypothetical protein
MPSTRPRPPRGPGGWCVLDELWPSRLGPQRWPRTPSSSRRWKGPGCRWRPSSPLIDTKFSTSAHKALDAPEPGNKNGTAVYQPVLTPKQKPASSSHPIHVFVVGNCPTHPDGLGNNKSKLLLASKAVTCTECEASLTVKTHGSIFNTRQQSNHFHIKGSMHKKNCPLRNISKGATLKKLPSMGITVTVNKGAFKVHSLALA